ncbi:uncharacterized protein LOC106461927 [Limulus polyphemus]|uniref:Uncharacterized protein LOC106461927 n=1 Tax=Limulus polyphemus TaxID=6850 RepID=A0ABM1B8Z8_LIMPO|nr:uncharacterized protein LOC106461927 [Limulus polyphemus]
MFRWVVLFIVFTVVAAEDYFATGLGTLDPNYSQKLGPDGSVRLDFRQKKNGFSYSVSNSADQNGAAQQHTAISKDALGGHTIEHASHGHHTNPYTGQTDVKHSEHSFHINPYLGKAAVHSNDAAGHLSPQTSSADYQQDNYDAQIAPGLKVIQKSHDDSSISPYGNHASHSVHNAHAAAVPGGIAHTSHTAKATHDNLPGLGGYTQAQVADVHGLQGPGYGALSQAAQNTHASYGPYGLAAEVKQGGYAADNVYNAHLNYAGGNEHAFTHHAARHPYNGYQQVTHTTNAVHEGPIYPGAGGYIHAGHGYVQGGYAPLAYGPLPSAYPAYGHKK